MKPSTSVERPLPPLGIRWTIGDVSIAGFQALRLSICYAWRIFGIGAKYAVCVNSIPLAAAIERTGELPCQVAWLRSDELLPAWLREHVTAEMAEGVAWKLAPVRVFPERRELSLDNDVILWAIPEGMRAWLAAGEPDASLLAGDLAPALGQFAQRCGYRALNSGIRGLAPGFDMEARLRHVLQETAVRLQSELDEQGLQAAVLLATTLFVVRTDEVSICSPFPQHQKNFGTCGAHFVALNPKRLPWLLNGRGAHEAVRECWAEYMRQLSDFERFTGASDLKPDRAKPWQQLAAPADDANANETRS